MIPAWYVRSASIPSITGVPTYFGNHEVSFTVANQQDIGFILGKGGQTKKKIQIVSGANIEVNSETSLVKITGTELNIIRCQEYIDLVLAQGKGAVLMDASVPRDDCSFFHVPVDCVGFITGAGRRGLRELEENWNVLCFFMGSSETMGDGGSEILAIFGRTNGRIGAILKVMSSLESKKPGAYIRDGQFIGDLRKEISQAGPDFGLEYRTVSSDDISYALGQGGNTKRKVARAAGCFLEYIGLCAVYVGTTAERKRLRDYLEWLLIQRIRSVHVNTEGRNDVTVCKIDPSYIGYVAGIKGVHFREIEQDTGVFMFSNEDDEINPREGKGKIISDEVLIFSYDERARMRAYDLVRQRIALKASLDRNDDHGRRRGGRSRSPPRRYDGGGGRAASSSNYASGYNSSVGIQPASSYNSSFNQSYDNQYRELDRRGGGGNRRSPPSRRF